MAIDTSWYQRLSLLADLMVQDPNKLVRKLQWEALKYYPLSSTECIRGWMKIRVAFLAADLILLKPMEISSMQTSYVDKFGVTKYGF